MKNRILQFLTRRTHPSTPVTLSRKVDELLAQDCATIQEFIDAIQENIHTLELSDTAKQHLYDARNNLEQSLGKMNALQNDKDYENDVVSLYHSLREAFDSLEDALYCMDHELHLAFDPIVTRLMIFLRDFKHNLEEPQVRPL